MSDLGLHRLGSALDAARQAMDFVGAMAGYLDRDLRAKAESDLFWMEANLQKDANEFLDEMRASGDYTNFGERTREFLNGWNERIDAESKNPYTARKAREMLAQRGSALQDRVRDEVFARQKDDVLSQNAMAMQMNADNLGGQDLAAANGEIRASQVANGIQTLGAARAEAVAEGGEIYAKEYMDAFSPVLEEAVATGNVDLLFQAIDGANPQIQIFAPTGHTDADGNMIQQDVSSAIDRGRVKGKVKELARDKYNAGVVAMQKGNANTLSELYNQLWQGDVTGPQRLQYCKAALRRMEREMGGHRLSEPDRAEYTDRFRRIIAAEEEALNAVVNGGASPKDLESFQTYMKRQNAPDMFMQDVANGRISAYDARRALQSQAAKDWAGRPWKEREGEGRTNAEAQEWFDANYRNYGESLLDTQFMHKFIAERFPALQSQADLAVKDMRENPDRYTPAALSTFDLGLVDIVAAADGDVPEEVLQERLRSLTNSLLLSGGEDAYRDKGGVFGIGRGKRFGTDEVGLARMAQSLLEEDHVFTDAANREVWTSPEAKRNAEENRDDLAHTLAEWLGVDYNDIVQEWSYTRDDMDTRPVFRVHGETYTVELTGVDKKGRATGFRFVDRDGNEVESTAIPMTEKERAIADRKDARAASREHYNSPEQRDDRMLKRIVNPPSEVRGLGVTQAQWDNATPAQRRGWLEEAGVDAQRFIEGR